MKPDKLNRKEYIRLLIEIITNQSEMEQGYTIAIDGIWGCGKSYILDAVTENLKSLQSNKPFLIFRYNCWENDFYEEPLVALATIIVENLNLREDPDAKEIISTCVNTIIHTASLLIEMKTGINPSDFLNAIKEHSGSIFSLLKPKIKTEAFNNQKSLQEAIKTIQNALKELTTKYSLVLLIDELDRCLPEYAIKVLERLHHLCYGTQIVSVISLDKKQLADGIAKVFGKEFNKYPDREKYTIPFSDLYLQKFIDISIPLNTGDLNTDEPLIFNILDSYVEYVRNTNLGQSLISLDKQYMISFYIALFNGIDIRTQEKILAQVKLCHELTIKSGEELESYQYQILIYELLTCISYFLLKRKTNCFFRHIQNTNCILEFFNANSVSKTEYEIEYSILNSNLNKIFNMNIQNYDIQNFDHNNFLINDNKSFIAAYFSEPKVRFTDPLQNMFREMIIEDKKFLNKYEAIMKQLSI